MTDRQPVTGHQPALDGLRVVAALAVLALHVGGMTGFAYSGTPGSWAISRGAVGVPIFFALSGLLLYRPWAVAALRGDRPPVTFSYLGRRAIRILPAYWTVVIVAMFTLNVAHVRSILAWCQYLLLVQIYDPHPWWPGTGAAGLEQMWSLATEVSFYLALPLLAALLGRYAHRAGPDVGDRARRLLAGTAVLALAPFVLNVAEFHPSYQPWLGDTLTGTLTWFAVGMAVAVLAVWARLVPQSSSLVRRFTTTVALSPGACLLIAALIFIVSCTPVAGPETLSYLTLWQVEVRTALFAVIAAAILAPVAFQPVKATAVTAMLGNAVMRFLGKVSYGIYLWQYVVAGSVFAVLRLPDAFHGGSGTFNFLAAFAVVTAVSVAAATASYYLIEQPARMLYHAILPARPGRHRLMAATADSAPVRLTSPER